MDKQTNETPKTAKTPKAPKAKAEKKNGKAAKIAGVIIAKVDAATIAKALQEVQIDPAETLEVRVEQLVGYYTATYSAADVSKCDDCGGLSVEADPFCPFCSAPFTDETALVVPPAMPESLYKVEDLEQNVGEIKRYAVESLTNMHSLGAAIRENYEKNLWRLRVGDDGKPTHKTFRDFCTDEIGLSHTWVYKLMDIAGNFTSEDVKQLGTSKLGLILKAPEQHRDKLIEQARQGASKSVIEKAVDKINKKINPKPEPVAPKDRLMTIAIKPGRKTVPLMKRPAKKGDEQQPAKKLGDDPWCAIPLSNDVQLLARVMQTDDGTLKLVVEFRRVVAGDESA